MDYLVMHSTGAELLLHLPAASRHSPLVGIPVHTYHLRSAGALSVASGVALIAMRLLHASSPYLVPGQLVEAVRVPLTFDFFLVT